MKRAQEVASSIDPGEDAGQQQILFQRLASSLHGEADNIQESIRYVRDTDDDDTISLNLRVPLPSPLPALHWSFKLHREDSSIYLHELTGPLLQRLNQTGVDVSDLHARLAEKDHVISKLVERLEAFGTDLTAVFPGTSNVKLSRAKSQRAQLGRYVKGLDVFHPEEWESSTIQTHDVDRFVPALQPLRSLPDDSPLLTLGGVTDDTEDTPKNEGIEIEIERRQANTINVVKSKTTGGRSADASDSETESEDEDFQPPHHDDAPASHNNPQDQKSQSPPIKQSPLRAKNGSATSQQRSANTEPNGASRKARIGMIGLHKKKGHVPAEAVNETHDDDPDSELDVTTSSQPPSTPKKSKIGLVGGRKPEASDAGQVQDRNLTMTSTQQASPTGQSSGKAKHSPKESGLEDARATTSSPRIRETSQERADHRREQLKRQLGTQDATAAAKKKKRKF